MWLVAALQSKMVACTGDLHALAEAKGYARNGGGKRRYVASTDKQMSKCIR